MISSASSDTSPPRKLALTLQRCRCFKDITFLGSINRFPHSRCEASIENLQSFRHPAIRAIGDRKQQRRGYALRGEMAKRVAGFGTTVLSKSTNSRAFTRPLISAKVRRISTARRKFLLLRYEQSTA